MGLDAPLYPVGLIVQHRRCLVVGGGTVAARKVAGLLACGAVVTVVAPEVHEAVAALAQSGALEAVDDDPVHVELRPYRAGEAASYALVVAATGDDAVDDAVSRDARAAGVWVNVADDLARCSFVLPAVARDGAVTVAVSTGGSSPALAGWLRDRVAAALGHGAGALAQLLDEARRRVQATGTTTAAVDWATLLDGPLPTLVAEGRMDEARAVLDAFLAPFLNSGTRRHPGDTGPSRP